MASPSSTHTLLIHATATSATHPSKRSEAIDQGAPADLAPPVRREAPLGGRSAATGGPTSTHKKPGRSRVLSHDLLDQGLLPVGKGHAACGLSAVLAAGAAAGFAAGAGAAGAAGAFFAAAFLPAAFLGAAFLAAAFLGAAFLAAAFLAGAFLAAAFFAGAFLAAAFFAGAFFAATFLAATFFAAAFLAGAFFAAAFLAGAFFAATFLAGAFLAADFFAAGFFAAAFFAVAITFSLIKLQKHRPSRVKPSSIGYSPSDGLAAADMAAVAPVR